MGQTCIDKRARAAVMGLLPTRHTRPMSGTFTSLRHHELDNFVGARLDRIEAFEARVDVEVRLGLDAVRKKQLHLRVSP